MMQELEYPMLPEHIIHHIKTTTVQRWVWDVNEYDIRDKLMWITHDGSVFSMSPKKLRRFALSLWENREQLAESGFDYPIVLYGRDRAEAFLNGL